MNLYFLTQVDRRGYDTYDSMVVASTSENAARLLHPYSSIPEGENHIPYFTSSKSWAFRPENVEVTLLGKAVKGTKEGIICKSFNAG